MDDFLTFDRVTKSFGASRAVNEVSLSISRGEVFSLLGPSGCGKTTLLRMAAGFEAPDSGRILLNGKDVTALPPEKRPVNTVFQSYALFPHLSVFENIAFGLRVKKRSKAELTREVEAMLELTQLTDHAQKRPSQLSGGQKQRVAIARALVNKPEVLLLDEPLAALDLKLRQHMLTELRRLHDEVGITFIYVTHDQGEAMGLSNRIAVMNEGRIMQLGGPIELYEKPQNRFVASFIGDANLLASTVVAVMNDGLNKIQVPGLGELLATSSEPLSVGQTVELSIRPERISQGEKSDDSTNSIEAILDETTYLGSSLRCVLVASAHRLSVDLPPQFAASLNKGDKVRLTFAASHTIALPCSVI